MHGNTFYALQGVLIYNFADPLTNITYLLIRFSKGSRKKNLLSVSTTKLEGEGGIRTLVVGPLKKDFFGGFPCERFFSFVISIKSALLNISMLYVSEHNSFYILTIKSNESPLLNGIV